MAQVTSHQPPVSEVQAEIMLSVFTGLGGAEASQVCAVMQDDRIAVSLIQGIIVQTFLKSTVINKREVRNYSNFRAQRHSLECSHSFKTIALANKKKVAIQLHKSDIKCTIRK